MLLDGNLTIQSNRRTLWVAAPEGRSRLIINIQLSTFNLVLVPGVDTLKGCSPLVTDKRIEELEAKEIVLAQVEQRARAMSEQLQHWLGSCENRASETDEIERGKQMLAKAEEEQRTTAAEVQKLKKEVVV